ncbi:hypothetical protein FNI43_17855 [Salmonella enterica subsp. diarizonae]|nr:hypothetical protein [Salmonella enterica]EBY0802705.1 hypothetical protein [Salmonella enterica subsp. enterica serovar Berlin]ECF5936758.1 hypothetical protein [Salmonella enterica subsp. diarizonae]ECI3333180.1 hypothetical protein [Salmonella enterica subsp. diarizonae]ECI3628365.1 hypothetical protein [Salmonella enterica subsp. diarizonae]
MLGKAAPRWQRRKASQLKLRNLAFAGFFVSRLIYFLLGYPKRVISVSYIKAALSVGRWQLV